MNSIRKSVAIEREGYLLADLAAPAAFHGRRRIWAEQKRPSDRRVGALADDSREWAEYFRPEWERGPRLTVIELMDI